MYKIKIQKINPNTNTISVANNNVDVFQGKFLRHPDTGASLPPYTTPIPADYVLIKATTFNIVGNSKYSGKYTVYSPTSASDTKSSVFENNNTIIKVNETLPALESNDNASLESDGYVTNISTYLLLDGNNRIIVPPGVTLSSYSIDFPGRDVSSWGEDLNQNILDTTRNFAANVAPINPFIGQVWYSTDDNQVRTFNGSTWEILNQATFGIMHTHTQSQAATEWTVNHFLNLAAPFIAFTEMFVDRGNGPKKIMPSDITFVNANQLKVTFSNPEIGYVLVRK